MPWEVEYTDEFAAWWDTLTAAQQVEQAVVALSLEGPALGRPLVDTIKGSRLPHLKELRVSKGGALRVLFVFNPLRTAVLLLGGDKSGRWAEWYQTAIPEAEKLYGVHLDELRKEGLWPDTGSSETS
ncbi:MAG TPA: type II toxin-antitoxin system RelE/ParE family toxin [Chloroflexota bacterium]|nr:type II toxin-antitoxin system RelE/ParE family toxin [Chloroflexota bacterium]